MEIRKAKFEDLSRVVDIFENVINSMINNNIDQWDETYPSTEIIKDDILKKEMYIGVKDDVIVSTVVVNSEFDNQYENGKWKYDNQRYVVIHRLCVNPIYQNQKVGRNTMIMIEDLLNKEGVQAIRLDAFSLNPYALKMYETLGYKKVGEAKWRKGLFYLFEKKL